MFKTLLKVSITLRVDTTQVIMYLDTFSSALDPGTTYVINFKTCDYLLTGMTNQVIVAFYISRSTCDNRETSLKETQIVNCGWK